MYGLQILVDFTVTFITLTTCIFFCIRFITQLHLQTEVTGSESVTRALVVSVVWLSLVMTKLVLITASCSGASAEGNYPPEDPPGTRAPSTHNKKCSTVSSAGH
jgi:hypothetical protein